MFQMQMGVLEIECEFFIVDVNVPILLGNDVMVPLGGKIDMEENKLILKKADMEIPLVHTKGGHFVIAVKSVAGLNYNNITGDEADAVMIMVLEETDEENVKKVHDEIGHATFVALALIKKVHRFLFIYFYCVKIPKEIYYLLQPLQVSALDPSN